MKSEWAYVGVDRSGAHQPEVFVMAAIESQNIDHPHESRPYKAHGHMDVITFGDFTMGK